MSKYLFDTQLSEILPRSIRHDETVQAVLEGLQPELTQSFARIAELMLFSRLYDTEKISEEASGVLRRAASLGGYRRLEESLLDMLAWQFHVDDYDIARTYREKLEMVRASIQIHRKKGTKWAIKRAVEAALQDTELRIKEWFEADYLCSGQGINRTGSAMPRSGSEAKTALFASDSECQTGSLTERHGEAGFEADYNGSPYHFKAELMIFGEEVLESHLARAKRIIENTKSLRSHCDNLSFSIGAKGEYRYGSCLGMGSIVTVEPELITEVETEHHYLECGILAQENVLYILPAENEPIPPLVLNGVQNFRSVFQNQNILVVFPDERQEV